MAVDLQAAFRRGTFGEYTRPFVGYLGLLEDSPASRAPVKDISPNFPLVPEYRNASYADRYNILCEKLMAESLYTAAAVAPAICPGDSNCSRDTPAVSRLRFLCFFVGSRKRSPPPG